MTVMLIGVMALVWGEPMPLSLGEWVMMIGCEQGFQELRPITRTDDD